MTNTEKIFVDLDEEINFVLEKIRSAASDKVILIIPKSANLSSSLISLKVLAKQLTKIDKVVIMASEDEFGRSLAEKSRLVSVENPGDIGPEVWERAVEMREELKGEFDRRKHMLLERRSEKPVEKPGSDYKIVDEKEEEPEEEKEEIGKLPSAKEEEEIKPLRPQTRVPAKVVTVGTVKFFAAGDILENEELLTELLPQKPKEEKNEEGENDDDGTEEGEESDEGEEESNDKEEKSKDDSKFERRRSIIGQDYAGIMPTKRAPRQSFNSDAESGVSPITLFIEKVKLTLNKYLDTPQKKKLAMVVTGVLIFLLLFTTVFSSQATVKVTLKKDNVSINEEIKANPAVQGINVQSFEIPAEVRSSEDTASESGSATGQGTTGEKAEGVVTLVNATDNALNVPVGTKLTLISSGLIYITVSASSIPAVGTKDVGVVAEKAGANYNASPDKIFSVQGFSESTLRGRNFTGIQGGTTEEITVVSQADLDTVKDVVKKRVESNAQSKLESLAATEELILKETITVEILEENTTRKVGEETENFDVSVKAKVSAIFVKKSDVEDMAKEIAKIRQPIEGDTEINIAVFPKIENVKLANGIATFTISSEASAKAKITEETLSENISGKSVGEAESYMSDLAEVEEFSIDYSPAFLPSFLKRMPSGDSLRIKISK